MKRLIFFLAVLILPLILSGVADAAAAYANYQGIIDYKGKQNKDLRALWGGYITPLNQV